MYICRRDLGVSIAAALQQKETILGVAKMTRSAAAKRHESLLAMA